MVFLGMLGFIGGTLGCVGVYWGDFGVCWGMLGVCLGMSMYVEVCLGIFGPVVVVVRHAFF